MGKQFDIPIANLSAFNVKSTSELRVVPKEIALPLPSNSKTVFQSPLSNVCLAGSDLDLFWQSLP